MAKMDKLFYKVLFLIGCCSFRLFPVYSLPESVDSVNVQISYAQASYENHLPIEEMEFLYGSGWRRWQESLHPKMEDSFIKGFNSLSSSDYPNLVLGTFPNAKYCLFVSILQIDDDGDVKAFVVLRNTEDPFERRLQTTAKGDGGKKVVGDDDRFFSAMHQLGYNSKYLLKLAEISYPEQ